MRFDQLGLSEPILRAVVAEGYTTPTPIQVQAIPHVLAGRDLLGCAQTGTGKTAAFALPILHRLHHSNGAHPRVRPIRVLVLSPTRELASQIGESFRVYGKNTGLRGVVIYGGVNQNRQTSALHGGADILVATPGRLLDLMEQGFIDLGSVAVLVLDEADRMLDMGFIHDIRKIVAKVPKARQTLFFSATMPAEIRKLADNILHKPVSVQVAAESAAADNVQQSVYHVKKQNKSALLIHLLRATRSTRSLVFTRTKGMANRVVRRLELAGVAAEAIHSNKSQNARERAIQNFKTTKIHVLVATDIAARGLDIDDISHVVNFDLPNVPETYVHRIGRTARAGATGIAVSFCDPDERSHLRAIEHLIRKSIPVNHEQPEYPAAVDPADLADRPRQSPPHRPNRPKKADARSQSHAASSTRGSSHSHVPSQPHAPARSDDAPAPRRGRGRRGKPGGRHGRREEPVRSGSSENRGAAPRRDSDQRTASPARENGPSHNKPAAAPAQVGHRLRGRGKPKPHRGQGPRR